VGGGGGAEVLVFVDLTHSRRSFSSTSSSSRNLIRQTSQLLLSIFICCLSSSSQYSHQVKLLPVQSPNQTVKLTVGSTVNYWQFWQLTCIQPNCLELNCSTQLPGTQLFATMPTTCFCRVQSHHAFQFPLYHAGKHPISNSVLSFFQPMTDHHTHPKTHRINNVIIDITMYTTNVISEHYYVLIGARSICQAWGPFTFIAIYLTQVLLCDACVHTRDYYLHEVVTRGVIPLSTCPTTQLTAVACDYNISTSCDAHALQNNLSHLKLVTEWGFYQKDWLATYTPDTWECVPIFSKQDLKFRTSSIWWFSTSLFEHYKIYG